MIKKKLFDISNRLAQNVFRNSTQPYFLSRLEECDEPELLKCEKLAFHFGHQVVNEIAFQYVTGGLIVDRLNFIKNCLGDHDIQHGTFLDVGDSDGIFLEALHKKGISANISGEVVKILTKKGYIAIRCDAEQLPFRTGSVDYILFFAILEHVTNPIQVLKELNRVTRISAFVSIASMKKTNIHKYMCFPDNPPFEQHVFEFSDQDFRKIVTHAGFTVDKSKIVSVFCPRKLRDKVRLGLFSIFIPIIKKDGEYKNNREDILFGCFRRFGIYHLIKTENNSS